MSMTNLICQRCVNLSIVQRARGSHNNKCDISVYGQEYTIITYKLAKMNLAIRVIACNLGEMAADTFHNDQHNTKTVQTEWKVKTKFFFPEVPPVFIRSITFYYPIMDSSVSLC